MSYLFPIALILTGVTFLIPDRTMQVIAGILLIIVGVLQLAK